MSYSYSNIRKQVLQLNDPSSSAAAGMAYYGHPQGQPGPQHVPMPMTPMDFSYSQSMLPANLFQTPSPYVNHPTFLGPQSSPGVSQYPQSLHNMHSMHSLHSLQSNSSIGLVSESPYVFSHPPQLQHKQEEQLYRQSSLEHLNFSRSVVLSGLSPNLTLRELLNQIDHGPLECAELKPDLYSEKSKEEQICILAFVNTHVSYRFFQHYAKQPQNLKSLRERIGNSPNFKISLADAANSSDNGQDVIKVKTLNYLLEVGATRAIFITFQILDSDLVPLMERAFRTRCASFGVVEDFVLTEDDENSTLEFLVHFSSIDAAIALYEHYSQQVPKSDDPADLVQLSCLKVAFQRDRCDRSTFFVPVMDALSGPGSPKTKNATTERSPSTSSHASELPLALKPLDLCAEPKFPTRATSEQLSDVPDPKSTLQFGSEQSALASPGIEHTNFFVDHSFGSHSANLPEPHFTAHTGYVNPNYTPNSAKTALQSQHSDNVNRGNRTIYLGNLHPRTTLEEIANNVRAGGLVESFKYHPVRRVCFVTFVDAAIALKFYLSHQVLHQLVIRDTEVTVSWGSTHSGPLLHDVALAVSQGASRNVYIGFHIKRTGPPGLRIPNEATLRRDFSRFGGLEQINHYHRKDCGFMNFLKITDAIRVVECFESRDAARASAVVGDNGEFYEKYRHFKISYGKDRCANELRFSFVKRHAQEEQMSDLEDNPANNFPKHKNTIDEDAANVFGIREAVGAAVVSDVLQESSSGLEETAELQEKSKVVCDDDDEGANQCDANTGDNVDDDDDDDEISIIINSESTNSSQSHQKKKTRRKPQKIYHHNLELSDLLNAAYGTHDASFTQMSYDSSFESLGSMGPDASPSRYQRPQPPISYYSRSNIRHPYTLGPYYQNGNYASGSQVMAEYLARSQHDQYLYAATAFNNGDASAQDLRDVKRPGCRSIKR